MKNTRNLLIINAALILFFLLALTLHGQPVALGPPVAVDPNTVAEKIDDKTVKVTVTTTTIRVSEQDKAELQTEKDHIPEQIVKLNEQIDTLNERSAEIDKILSVFK